MVEALVECGSGAFSYVVVATPGEGIAENLRAVPRDGLAFHAYQVLLTLRRADFDALSPFRRAIGRHRYKPRNSRPVQDVPSASFLESETGHGHATRFAVCSDPPQVTPPPPQNEPVPGKPSQPPTEIPPEGDTRH